MIPLRDTTPSRSYPVVNTALIGINVMVFFYQMSLGPNIEQFFYTYGMVPVRYTDPRWWDYFGLGQQLFSFFSFMFLHGGFWHLLGNMWSLWIFGDNVEDHMGPLRYLLFYLLCGIFSGMTHLLFNLKSGVPTIGASGAIAGVMGAYFILFPRARVLTLVPIVIIPFFFEIPAKIFLGIWFVFQFLSAARSQGVASGVAWWAHIGGFVIGIILLKFIDLLPTTGISTPVRRAATKKHSHRLQVLHPAPVGENANLYATIEITPYEALLGTTKVVNIPWGFQKRMFKVTVPAGTSEGSKLRLKGQGRKAAGGEAGDLLLTVAIRKPADVTSGS